MDSDTRDLITWVLGTTLAVCAIVGMMTRFVLLPWLREHLVAPMKAVKKQVSENHHHNDNPTVLDRIDDVQNEVKDVAAQIKAMGEMFDGHLAWSERWVDLIEREMDILRRERPEE